MLECKVDNDVCIVTFDHYLNTNVCHRTEADLLEKIKSLECTKLTFDLNRVEYIASAFIRICLAAAEIVQYQNFSIINTTPFIKKVFKIAGLDEKLHVS